MTEIITAKDINFAEVVRQVGTLVACKTHKWGATKRDGKAGRDVAAVNHARSDATTVTKNLLVGANTEYKALCDEINRAWRDHKAMTAEWSSDGSGNRLLANRRVFDYAEVMSQHRTLINEKLKPAFGAIYAQRRDEALANLGALADPADYPTEEEILARFGVEMIFSPVPSGTDFKYLEGGWASALSANLNQRVTAWVDNAMTDGWKRLGDTIDKMAQTLKDEEQMKFKGSLVKNVQDMLELVKDFNITGKPEYDELVKEVEERLTKYDSKQLKASVGVRRQVASDADAVLAKLASYGLAQQAA